MDLVAEGVLGAAEQFGIDRFTELGERHGFGEVAK